jgi:hypothetical protein
LPPQFALPADDSSDEAERQPEVSVGEPTLAPTSRSIRTDIGRVLADAVSRALAVGDARTARVALAALSGLVDEAPDGSGLATNVDAERKSGR